MSKDKIQTLKGFQDIKPGQAIIYQKIIYQLALVFKKYGFDEIMTPAIEYQKVLLGKYGEEAEKLIYLFKDRGDRKVGLRYDLTVPLARFISENKADLTFPFKRFQIQPVWRAEKPQRGRYREFIQCDVDIVGSKSFLSDTEIVLIIKDCLDSLKIKNYQIKINSREVLNDCLKKAKVPKKLALSAIQSIDKLSKKGKSKVKKELEKKGLTKTQIKNLFTQLEKAKPDEYLEKIISLLESSGLKKKLVFDPNLSRGLDYYTGPIFEVETEDKSIGSILGGGRYDNLLKDIGGPDLPAVGVSFGIDRIYEVVQKLDSWKKIAKTQSRVLVTIFSKKLFSKSFDVANLLRRSGINTELYFDKKADLKKQLKYADKKNIPWAVIIGPDEVVKDQVVLKNLSKNTQEKIPTKALLTKIV